MSLCEQHSAFQGKLCPVCLMNEKNERSRFLSRTRFYIDSIIPFLNKHHHDGAVDHARALISEMDEMGIEKIHGMPVYKEECK